MQGMSGDDPYNNPHPGQEHYSQEAKDAVHRAMALPLLVPAAVIGATAVTEIALRAAATSAGRWIMATFYGIGARQTGAASGPIEEGVENAVEGVTDVFGSSGDATLPNAPTSPFTVPDTL